MTILLVFVAELRVLHVLANLKTVTPLIRCSS